MACLCAPTTHEGSFRCRFHRAAPPVLATTSPSAQSASSHQKLGAFPYSPLDISARLQTAARAESPPSASAATSSAAPHPPNCNLPSSPPPMMSSSSSSLSSKPPCRASSSPTPSRCARLPPAKQHILSPTSPSRSRYPGSSTTSELAAAAMAGTCRSAPSGSHAAAMAIMKQHLHNSKYNIKSHVSRRENGTVLLRSSAVYKIGPSRLSRMSRACADEVPLLKNVDRCFATPKPQKSSSFYSDAKDEPLPIQLPWVEATQINFNMHSTRAKLKQSDSSCKIVGHKAGPFFLSAVY